MTAPTDTITPSAEATVSIGTTAADAAGDTFIQLGGLVTVPSFGPKYGVGKVNLLSSRNVKKYKTSRDDGAIDLQLAQDLTDPGQAACETALASDSFYNLKVTLNDAGSGAGATPTTITMKVLVTGLTTDIEGTEDYVKTVISVEVQSGSIVRTAATAGT